MNDLNPSFCSIVLAGGKSRRLGRNKQLESVGGRNIVSCVISTLQPLSEQIFLVTSDGATISSIVDGFPPTTRVVDIYPGCGTLGGIYTGLRSAPSLRSFVAACDMPFLNSDLVKYLVRISADFDLVLPRIGRFVEPLHAVYSRNCLEVMERRLKAGDYKVTDIAGLVNTRYVDSEEMDKFDPQHLSFFNVNTQHDLQIANGIAEAGMEARGAGNIVCGLV